MALVRTNITVPEDVLALVDELAGPRGRSAYLADVITRHTRRELARRAFRETAGVLRGSESWGRTSEETDGALREVRAAWDADPAREDVG